MKSLPLHLHALGRLAFARVAPCWPHAHAAGIERERAFSWNPSFGRAMPSLWGCVAFAPVDNFRLPSAMHLCLNFEQTYMQCKSMISLKNPLKSTKLFNFSTLYNGRYVNNEYVYLFFVRLRGILLSYRHLNQREPNR